MERTRPDPDSDFLIIFSTLTVIAWLATLVWFGERVDDGSARGWWPIALLWLTVAVSWVQFHAGAGWWRGVAAGFALSAAMLFGCTS